MARRKAYGLRRLATGHAQGEAQGLRATAAGRDNTGGTAPARTSGHPCAHQAKASNRPARRQEGQGGKAQAYGGGGDHRTRPYTQRGKKWKERIEFYTGTAAAAQIVLDGHGAAEWRRGKKPAREEKTVRGRAIRSPKGCVFLRTK